MRGTDVADAAASTRQDPDRLWQVVVSPHRFQSLETERSILGPLGADLVETGCEQDVRDQAGRADALLVTPLIEVDASLIRSLSRCRAIVRYGVGVDNVDVGAATAAGIPVGNVVDASVEEVADHAVLLALGLLRRLPDAVADLASGAWSTESMRGVRRLSTLTAGIVGMGRIGQAVARRFEAFGCRILAHDPFISSAPYPLVELGALLGDADIVSLHIPATDETRGLLSAERLRLLRPSAVVVNVSRGGLVDEAAVAELLGRGELWGAAFDVFDIEPLPADHPLRRAPHALLTPHVAWCSQEAAEDLQRKAAEQVARALRDRPLDPAVNPAVYD